ncbi:MAG: hypothetical protein IKC11_02855 [Clostridia bacterium]|nr:hypothetical protein [Clostridia bacterium]
MKYTIEIDTEKPTIVANEVLVFSKEKIIELLNYITCATSIIINEQKQENEQLKKKVSYLEDNLRVARKDREDLQDALANEIKDFIKEKPFTSLRFLANKELKEENQRLKAQIEKMITCKNCKHHKLTFDWQDDCKIKDCINKNKWELAE